MCGNAALCSTQLAARLGLANGRGMSLETDAGTYESRCAPGERAELRLAPVRAPQQVAGLSVIDGERRAALAVVGVRSEEHTSELQSQSNLVCRLLLEKKKNKNVTLP